MSPTIDDSLLAPLVRTTISLEQGVVHALATDPHDLDDRNPDLLFLHANGFCASTYTPLFAILAKEFNLLAPDFRAQGKTTLPAGGAIKSWELYRDDLLSLLQTLPRPPWLAGHSMGGTVSLLAAAKNPRLTQGVLAFDPPVLPRFLQWMMRLGLVGTKARERHPLVRSARSRRNTFSSREKAYTRFFGRKPFTNWQDGFLQGYLLDGLVKQTDGFELACHPDTESQNYLSHGHDIWGAMQALQVPALIQGGDQRGVVLQRSTLDKIDRLNPLISTRHLTGASHFLPMENPEATLRLICNFIKNQT